jgi:hypothetical protein
MQQILLADASSAIAVLEKVNFLSFNRPGGFARPLLVHPRVRIACKQQHTPLPARCPDRQGVYEDGAPRS